MIIMTLDMKGEASLRGTSWLHTKGYTHPVIEYKYMGVESARREINAL
jgi:hypothetical protein